MSSLVLIIQQAACQKPFFSVPKGGTVAQVCGFSCVVSSSGAGSPRCTGNMHKELAAEWGDGLTTWGFGGTHWLVGRSSSGELPEIHGWTSC